MKSHTVPKKLLEQFAYLDPKTKSLRLWRYEKSRSPFWKASPEKATVVDGVYADPRDSAKEAELEQRLNQEFEDPVHQFIHQAGYRTFVPSRVHIQQLTAYVSLLFHRSTARRRAARQQVDAAIGSYRTLLANEEQLRMIAGKWTLDIIHDGHASAALSRWKRSGLQSKRLSTINLHRIRCSTLIRAQWSGPCPGLTSRCSAEIGTSCTRFPTIRSLSATLPLSPGSDQIETS
jgi:hypothetical protein